MNDIEVDLPGLRDVLVAAGYAATLEEDGGDVWVCVTLRPKHELNVYDAGDMYIEGLGVRDWPVLDVIRAFIAPVGE